MKIHMLDTLKLYGEMLRLPDTERAAYFDETFLRPFAPMFERMGMPRNLDLLGCLALSGTDNTARDMLARLQEADAWTGARQAVELATDNLRQAGVGMPEEVVLGIFLGNPAMLAQSEGYTGAGSIPGYIQIVIAPNAYNVPRLASCVAHEFHHNALFSNVTWNFMNVTLSQYLAVEGLAETFAAELYGESFIGPG